MSAIFNGILGEQASGAEADFTVTGTEPTITTLSDQADGNNWDFTATVFGFGFPAATGMASFTDLTTMVNLGSAGLAGLVMSIFPAAADVQDGQHPVGVAVGDFNGDGIADLAIANQSEIPMRVRNGERPAGQRRRHLPGAADLHGRLEPSGIAVGDFNGDGIPRPGCNQIMATTVSVLLGNGDGTFPPAGGSHSRSARLRKASR